MIFGFFRFGTLASSAKAVEAVVVATAEEKKEEKATAAAAQVPVPDIEKSIKELEVSDVPCCMPFSSFLHEVCIHIAHDHCFLL